ncbi:hypothetical protein KP509_30G014800 [Ceratopteris richardii]|uniref:Uncharacterized protein n=1 Tax=Ceratopteris richardii TaxID=49495 RepID=A0A8T2R1K8_CERRI|nr:hypothetical protein KP509_30G014800 [Ceratopteris richardii]
MFMLLCTSGCKDDDDAKYRKNIEELRKLKKQIEEMDKEFDSFFTVENALKLGKERFEDPMYDADTDSSGDERPALEIQGPSEEEFTNITDIDDDDEDGADDNEDNDEDGNDHDDNKDDDKCGSHRVRE